MSLDALEGRICVLTGATGGIGRALAAVLAANGAKLLIAGRDEAALAALVHDLPPGSVLDTFRGDITDSRARLALAERAAAHSADTLVNLCGQNDVSLFESQCPDAIASMVAANLHAPMALTRLMLPALSGRPRPLVVNVGSVFGQIGYPGYAAYCATKFGLRGFSEALRRELQDTAVRIVHVEPRATRTGMNHGLGERLNDALGNRVDAPDDVAERIAHAMARNRPSTVIGFPERLYARINALLPSVIDRALAGQLSTLKKVLGTPPSTNL
ncbi:MAG: SDR family oxidoreductase [Pseudomonadales bacterium]